MKTPQRFNRAIAALVKAFFSETLAKGSCHACAVGNMVAAGLEKEKTPLSNGFWANRFMTIDGVQAPHSQSKYMPEEMLKLILELADANIAATGYSAEELARIEFAFETSTKIFYLAYRRSSKKEIIEDQFNGLMAVVDVLCDIEGINAEETKQLFAYEGKFELV